MQMLRNDLYKPWFKDSDWGFEVIDGEFSSVVVQVAKLQLKDETPEDPSNLSVEYHVIHKPEIITEEQVKSDLFTNLLETIVLDIVKEAVENYSNEVDRDNDPKEPDPQ
jgi:hypothetical protein